MLNKHQFELLKAKHILDICYFWDKERGDQEQSIVQQLKKDELSVLKKTNKIDVKMDEIENMMKLVKKQKDSDSDDGHGKNNLQ